MAKSKTPSLKDAAKQPATKELSSEDRAALNDKARFDYGIMNADQLSEKDLNKEMKTIDDQVKVGEKENKLAEQDQEARESNINHSNF